MIDGICEKREENSLTTWKLFNLTVHTFTPALSMPQPAHNDQIPERRKNSNDENSYTYD